VADSNKNAIGMVVITKNISERKRLQNQLIVSEKLAVVGQLAASFSHDIRNPLAVIKNSVCFLEMRLAASPDEKISKHLNILKEEINYATVLVNDVLDLTRKNPPRLQEADLNETVASALSSVAVPDSVKVGCKLEDLPPMLIDQTQFQRVFSNFITNAIQAMSDGGELNIQTARIGNVVELSFQDTGVGISEESRRHLFTPFFTTKSTGVGLGLSICKQIVEGHGGEISVESQVGYGTTFTVKLPIRHNDSIELATSNFLVLEGMEVNSE
jgi:signal transduction histidine kinase